MTREEKQKAIDALKISAPVITVTQKEFEDYIQTLNKIMDWLEQEPCDDAISKQAVAEVLLKYAHSAEGKAFAEFLISQINDLPPITPQYTDTEIQKMQDLEFAEIQKAYEIGKAENPNKWIPVSERLPKAGEYVGDVAKYYLVQNEYGDMLVARYTHGEYWEQIYQLKPIGDEIVAWMPLPEPYKASPTGEEVEE